MCSHYTRCGHNQDAIRTRDFQFGTFLHIDLFTLHTIAGSMPRQLAQKSDLGAVSPLHVSETHTPIAPWSDPDPIGNVCTLQWRHNERDGVSNHRRLEGLLNRLFMRGSKKASKIRVTGFYEGNSIRWPVISPHKGPVSRKMFPFDDDIMNVNVAVKIYFQFPVGPHHQSLILIQLGWLNDNKPGCIRYMGDIKHFPCLRTLPYRNQECIGR